MPDDALIQTRDAGPIRELRLSRPPVNALDDALCAALVNAIDQAVDDGIHGLVLGGNDGVFSAGLDVPWLMSLGEDRDALTAAWHGFFQAARALAGSPLPVVVAIGGHCPAGGCVLSLCCDYRIMAAGPWQIGLNELQVGLTVPEGIQRLLRRTVGAYRAERLLLHGHMVDGVHALDIGLVDERVAPQALWTRSHDWLQALLALPRAPMLATRATARADLVQALSSEHVDLAGNIRDWYQPDTQAALRQLLQRLGKTV
ncbi:MAG: enoyl-CoA hydratase/isomerase family protein [Pseudoxanthomonas suwonensis]|nr:enoyl-CoA hydratase/isomerase family protein [Pseudoxanthomonas suwonensis]